MGVGPCAYDLRNCMTNGTFIVMGLAYFITGVTIMAMGLTSESDALFIITVILLVLGAIFVILGVAFCYYNKPATDAICFDCENCGNDDSCNFSNMQSKADYYADKKTTSAYQRDSYYRGDTDEYTPANKAKSLTANSTNGVITQSINYEPPRASPAVLPHKQQRPASSYFPKSSSPKETYNNFPQSIEEPSWSYNRSYRAEPAVVVPTSKSPSATSERRFPRSRSVSPYSFVTSSSRSQSKPIPPPVPPKPKRRSTKMDHEEIIAPPIDLRATHQPNSYDQHKQLLFCDTLEGVGSDAAGAQPLILPGGTPAQAFYVPPDPHRPQVQIASNQASPGFTRSYNEGPGSFASLPPLHYDRSGALTPRSQRRQVQFSPELQVRHSAEELHHPSAFYRPQSNEASLNRTNSYLRAVVRPPLQTTSYIPPSNAFTPEPIGRLLQRVGSSTSFHEPLWPTNFRDYSRTLPDQYRKLGEEGGEAEPARLKIKGVILAGYSPYGTLKHSGSQTSLVSLPYTGLGGAKYGGTLPRSVSPFSTPVAYHGQSLQRGFYHRDQMPSQQQQQQTWGPLADQENRVGVQREYVGGTLPRAAAPLPAASHGGPSYQGRPGEFGGSSAANRGHPYQQDRPSDFIGASAASSPYGTQLRPQEYAPPSAQHSPGAGGFETQRSSSALAMGPPRATTPQQFQIVPASSYGAPGSDTPIGTMRAIYLPDSLEHEMVSIL